MYTKISTLLLSLFTLTLSAQVSNDDCFDATFINDIRGYCSGPKIYTTANAVPSDVANPVCWTGDQTNDIWVSFAARNTGLFFQISGASSNNEESLRGFSFALYEGRCNSLELVLCGRSRDGINIIERTTQGLTIGRIYHLRISSSTETAGTFELCTDSFNSVPSGEQDCQDAVVLCNKESFIIDFLSGGGLNRNEAAGTCLDNGPIPGSNNETSSAWYKWTAATSGTLTFTLTPNNVNDPREDLDFVVYELPRGLDNCGSKIPVRCMASGETQGNSAAQNAPCLGPTGLKETSSDVEETAGCSPGDDNFVAALDMVAGRSYALLINNYSQSGFGFSISFGGSGTFLGPEPEFAVKAESKFECLLPIHYDDQSLDINGDAIASYTWNFGEGAQPATATGNQRHTVVYNSFGTKYVVLTIKSTRGCIVTKVKEVEIAPCCLPTSDLTLNPEVTDLSCFESGDGRINVKGIGGQPDYLYSINGSKYSTNPRVKDLSAGTYRVAIQDAYGCEVDSNMVNVSQPAPLTLAISGPTDSIGLGEKATLTSTAGPAGKTFNYLWSPPNGLSCTDCPNPELVSSGSRVYTLQITDANGCTTSAQYNFRSAISRNYYAPNIISTKSNAGNHEFKIFTTISTQVIEEVNIYDRWGGNVYKAKNIVYNQQTPGWDGKVNGQKVEPGVYAWSARIRYLDDEVRQYRGSVTVVE